MPELKTADDILAAAAERLRRDGWTTEAFFGLHGEHCTVGALNAVTTSIPSGGPESTEPLYGPYWGAVHMLACVARSRELRGEVKPFYLPQMQPDQVVVKFNDTVAPGPEYILEWIQEARDALPPRV